MNSFGGTFGLAVVVVCGLAGPARAQLKPNASANGLLRVTAVWGNDDLVSGGTGEVAASSDRRRVAVSTQGGVIIWDTGGPEVRIPMPTSRYERTLLAFGAGDRVLVTARENDLAVWEVASGRKLGGVKPTGFNRPQTALGPGTSLAAVWESSEEHKLHLEIWDVESGKRVQQIDETQRWGTVTFLGGGRRLYMQSGVSHLISPAHAVDQVLWNVADGKVVYKDRTTGHCADGACAPVTAVLAPDGRTLVRTFDETAASSTRRHDRRGRHDEVRTPPQAPASRWVELVDLDSDRITVLERPTVGLEPSLAADGRTLACAASEPGQIAIWDLGRRVRRTVKLTETGAPRLRLSPHGSLLLVSATVSADDGWVSLYRTRDGTRLWHKPHVARKDARDLDLTVDDTEKLVLCMSGCPPPTEIHIVGWDAASGEPAFDLPGTGHRIWLSTKAGGVVPSSWGGLDLRAPAAPWRSLVSASGHRAPVTRVVVSPDGTSLASASADGRVLVRNLAAPGETFQLPEQGLVLDLAFRPDRGALAVAYIGRAVLWDLATRAPLAEQKWTGTTPVGVPQSRLLAGGRQVVFAPHYRGLEIRSLDDGRTVESMARPCGDQTARLEAVDFGGGGWCVAGDAEFTGAVRGLRSGSVRARYKIRPNYAAGQAIAVSRDGARALASNSGGGVALVTLTGAARVLPLPVNDAETTTLAFSPDGRRAFSGSVDGVLRMWDASTGALVDSFSLAERIDRPTSIGWAPDGRTLFVGTARGLVFKLEEAAK